MSEAFPGESLQEIFIFETMQALEQLENLILTGEQQQGFSAEDINVIFRMMHTIKGSAAVMGYAGLSTLSHAMEDLFYYLREHTEVEYDCRQLTDLLLYGVDFIQLEMLHISSGQGPSGEEAERIAEIHAYLHALKSGTKDSGESKAEVPERVSAHYEAALYFEKGCQMENVRAFNVVYLLEQAFPCILSYSPGDIIENPDSAEVISREGFTLRMETDADPDQLREFLRNAPYVETVRFIKANDTKRQGPDHPAGLPPVASAQTEAAPPRDSGQPLVKSRDTMINVNVSKMDKLMDLIGELVIAETMVTQNQDLTACGSPLDNFYNAARYLSKITAEVQDIVMSLRMVPLGPTFHKMGRIVRDMTRKLDKEAELVIIGEETEVDKNMIEHLADPLMHLVRNALDHGIELPEERLAAGKSRAGRITLEAKHAGGDVLVLIRDDGRGLHREQIVERALKKGLLTKDESGMSDKEVFRLIFQPGFSTKDSITEFSGRGVGMDVVVKDLEQVGGTASVDSVPGEGSTITLRIPLTLAIIDGINIGVGASRYTLPTASITRFFRAAPADLMLDPEGREMIMVRGQCYPVVRLERLFGVKDACTKLDEGVFLMVEEEDRSLCVFADQLLGQQQVVVKALPDYIISGAARRHFVGCTLLGDGSISLIVDMVRLTSRMDAVMN